MSGFHIPKHGAEDLDIVPFMTRLSVFPAPILISSRSGTNTTHLPPVPAAISSSKTFKKLNQNKQRKRFACLPRLREGAIHIEQCQDPWTRKTGDIYC